MIESTDKKLLYNTVLSQTFSPDGNYLLAGNIYGDVSVFDLSKALGPNKVEENELQGPTYRFAAHPDQEVACMLSVENFFVTGTRGEISGWDWKVITSNKAPKSKVSWNIQIPANKIKYKILGPGKSSWRFRSQFFNQKPQKFFTDGIMALPEKWRNIVDNNGRAMMPSVKNFCGFWLKNCDRKRHKLFPGPNICIFFFRDNYDKPDINYMMYSKVNNLLYVGCGDNNIYVINLEDRKILRSMQGHTDYIHCLAIMDNQLASCSEDGSVRLWDLRKRENTNILTPHLVDKVARPRFGKWIGAVDFTEDWLLCGGGPSLSLWHMRTMEVATIFDLADQGIHVAEIYEERVIASGATDHVHHMTYQGEVLAKVPTSSLTVYSVVHQETPHKVLSAAGSSNCIDISTNFNYREMTLKFA